LSQNFVLLVTVIILHKTIIIYFWKELVTKALILSMLTGNGHVTFVTKLGQDTHTTTQMSPIATLYKNLQMLPH